MLQPVHDVSSGRPACQSASKVDPLHASLTGSLGCYWARLENGTRVFFPHGAIFGLDGIFDGRNLWEKVSVESVKNPGSLGRADTERTVVYKGCTRDACREYPRNVNVHAAVVLAGIGFGRTVSKIVSDPAANANAHTIRVQGDNIEVSVCISSPASGVTSLYTPHSARGSLARALRAERERYIFV